MTASDVFRDSADLTVALDIRYPQAYLALHPTLRLAESMGIEVDWLPLPAAPLKAPTAPGPEDDRSILHRRHRAHAIAREIETYAGVQGLVLEEIYRDPPTDAFMMAWLYVRVHDAARLPRFLAESFRAYWARELDVADVSGMVGIVEASTGNESAFLEWAASEGEANVARVVDGLHDRGVFAVPSYLVEDEVFLGRQHLPMIRWILEGRRGAGPI